MTPDYSEDSDERLITSYAQSLLARDPAFHGLAEPIKQELLKRLFRGRLAYTAVQKAQASVSRSTSWVWLWLFGIAIGLAIMGLIK